MRLVRWVRGLQWLALLAWPSPLLAGAEAPAAGPALLLTNAQQVLGLGLDRPRAGDIAVRLRGVLTYQAVFRQGWIYVQDDTAATLVIMPTLPFATSPGQLVEVEGMAAAGIWSPFVQGKSIRLLGTAPMPAPKRTPAEELAQGADFGQWVELDATVRDVAVSKDRLVLQCTQNGQAFQAWVVHWPQTRLPLEFLDARVRVQGVAWTDVGYERRPYGFKLHVPATNFLQVLDQGAADVFSKPSRLLQTLRGYGGDLDTRVKISGVVTLHSPAGWLSLQDRTGPALAWVMEHLPRDDDPRGLFQAHPHPRLSPGDLVEVVGVPLRGRSLAPSLGDCEYRVISHTHPPAARPCSTSELMSGRRDAELVSLKGRVVDVESHRNGDLFDHKLWLQADEFTFEVMLQTADNRPLAVRKNDFVQASGICRAQPGHLQQVRSFSLHLHEPTDLVITRPPPWWTLRWAIWLMAGGAVITVAGLVWIVMLRRQVTRRTLELSESNLRLHDEIQKRRRFVSVIEATSDLVAMASLEGQVLYLNRAGRRIMELPESMDVTGMAMWEFYPEDINRLFREVAMPAAMRDGIWAGEVRLLTAAKREITVSFVGLVIKTAEGVPEHLACVARDLSDRQQTEENLRAALQAEKELNKLKSNFVSMVSHEFRTPLGVIQSSSELLARYRDRLPLERQERLLEAIVSSTGLMARMMEDVLLLSRVESARYDFHALETALAEWCHRLIDEVASATHARCPIELRLGELPETAWCDEGLLRHIFTNLLSNAVKYSPSGKPVQFRVDREGIDAVFTVQDQGLGIPAEDQPKLFQAFTRGSNVGDTPGTGLGLVIVQRCVTMHGGSLRIQSAPGQGTTVTVHLPLFVARESDTTQIRRRLAREGASPA